jgi:hypothetical protein
MSPASLPSQSFAPIDGVLRAVEATTGRRPRRTGKGYRCLCAACGGRSEKVSICESANGGVLLFCFCACSPEAFLTACGLTLSALFPARLAAMTPQQRRESRRWAQEANWAAALGVLGTEATVLEVAATMIERREPLSHDDIGRVRVAVDRIHKAREVLR